MDIVVLNGSPKGDISATMQYVAYIRKKFPGYTYTIINVAHEIKKIENDTATWNAVIDRIRSADLVLWAFPLYYLLVSSQYKRFIELVFSRDAGNAFAGKYTAALSTSIHFFDQTAHAYIHAICEDLGMRYLGFYSADMMDLLEEKERDRLEKFVTFLDTAVQEKIPVQNETQPLVWSPVPYVPGPVQKTVSTGSKKVVILTDSDGGPSNLNAMTERLGKVFSGSVETINLRKLNIRGGCLGCCQCGYDNTCVYTDGFSDFFKNTLVPADIIIIAGSVQDRYLSSVWKQFFDRSFFMGHIPSLEGKQIGFVIAGPLRQVSLLKEVLTAWADNGRCHAHFVTDEVSHSGELDGLLDALAGRLVQCAERDYIPPPTFYAVGGHKIFRDRIYGGLRIAFQADYRFYRKRGLLDFPQSDWRTRAFNTFFVPLTRIPAIRKRVFADIKSQIIKPYKAVLKNS